MAFLVFRQKQCVREKVSKRPILLRVKFYDVNLSVFLQHVCKKSQSVFCEFHSTGHSKAGKCSSKKPDLMTSNFVQEQKRCSLLLHSDTPFSSKMTNCGKFGKSLKTLKGKPFYQFFDFFLWGLEVDGEKLFLVFFFLSETFGLEFLDNSALYNIR